MSTFKKGDLVELESGQRLTVLAIEKSGWTVRLAFCSPSDHLCNSAIDELQFYTDVGSYAAGHLTLIDKETKRPTLFVTNLVGDEEIADVEKAASEGRAIEWKPFKVSYEPSWFDLTDPDDHVFDFKRRYYRVKETADQKEIVIPC